MADSASRGKKATKPAAVSTLSGHKILCRVIEGFVRANDHFGSSIPIDTALEEMGGCSDLQSVFPVPIKHKLFTMDVALSWLLFLTIAPKHAVDGGDALFAGGSFSSDEALELIANVYDIEVQSAVLDHFEEDSDEDEDEDDEDDEDDDDDDAKKSANKGGKANRKH